MTVNSTYSVNLCAANLHLLTVSLFVFHSWDLKPTHESHFPWIWRQKLKNINLFSCPALLQSNYWDWFLFYLVNKGFFSWFCLYIGLHKNLNFNINLKLLISFSSSLLKYGVSFLCALDKILSCNESSSLNWWWWLEIWYPSQLFTNSLYSPLIFISSSAVHGLLNIWCQFH